MGLVQVVVIIDGIPGAVGEKWVDTEQKVLDISGKSWTLGPTKNFGQIKNLTCLGL